MGGRENGGPPARFGWGGWGKEAGEEKAVKGQAKVKTATSVGGSRENNRTNTKKL